MAHPYKDSVRTGQELAKHRYGGVKGHPDANEIAKGDSQVTQDPQDRHGANYDNDVPSDWRRGMPTAEGKPGFDHRKKD